MKRIRIVISIRRKEVIVMNNSFDSLYAKAVKAGFFRKNDVGTTRVIGMVHNVLV